MLPKHISLISFAPPALSSELQDMLRNVQCDSTLVPGQIWLDKEPAHRNEPALLLFNGGEYPRAQIVATLKRQASRPFAVIIPRENSACDPEILSCCHDFIAWPCTTAELEFRLARLAVHLSCDTSSTEHNAELLEDFAALNLVGQSSAFIRALELIKKIARCDAAVLIEGETGTGKELAARAIHYLGARRDYPFIPLNCAAIPDNLFENELFGHERGAFTDAKTAQPGLVTQAQGGSLFLDEIDKLSLKGQATLLRFLQDQQFRPIGANKLCQADVRIIAAGNRDLAELVERGEFRQDLFFRLNIIRADLPPLRSRSGDITLLARHFLTRFASMYAQPSKRFAATTLVWLNRHTWPGNVRELENLIHREFLMSEGDEIRLHLGASGDSNRRKNPVDRRKRFPNLQSNFNEIKAGVIADFERSYLTALLSETGGNVTRAAHRAVKERRALGKLLKKHGIDAERYRDN